MSSSRDPRSTEPLSDTNAKSPDASSLAHPHHAPRTLVKPPNPMMTAKSPDAPHMPRAQEGPKPLVKPPNPLMNTTVAPVPAPSAKPQEGPKTLVKPPHPLLNAKRSASEPAPVAQPQTGPKTLVRPPQPLVNTTKPPEGPAMLARPRNEPGTLIMPPQPLMRSTDAPMASVKPREGPRNLVRPPIIAEKPVLTANWAQESPSLLPMSPEKPGLTANWARDESVPPVRPSEGPANTGSLIMADWARDDAETVLRQPQPSVNTGALVAGEEEAIALVRAPGEAAITGKLPETTVKLTEAPVTGMRVPVVIPAAEKRQRTTSPLRASYRRHPILLLSMLIGSVLMLIFAALFVVPLDNGQQENGFQAIGQFITTGQIGSLNPSGHYNPPTPTPALRTVEGYCGGTDIWGTCATAITASGVMGTGQMQRPIIGATITQAFGHIEYQFWCGCWKPHSGIDLAAPYGTPVMAADSGQVIWTGWDWSGLGWAVKINHGHYIATIYGHLERFIVKVGENVTKGQVIGYEGSSGASTGPHVHFMVMVNNVWVDPELYVPLP